MQNRLNLRLQDGEGALERLLGMVRQRGFQVSRFSATWDNADGLIEVTMEVDGAQPAMRLVSQLSELAEVRELAAWRPGRGSPSVAAAIWPR
ncbi:ACT domain-containing protein [Parachitinimonas caeni]|uniref:ACT domain-containing protein n=1 Tax=Parachitinimonas caeni TaxID=3031301 RepID=A0ABT7DYF4_9NEIS|nr:ACT domain-containing protein [Parachitinimonas caeni]MDK2124854.1 ACT domain-containing protein [Parachitinimonas caeni]